MLKDSLALDRRCSVSVCRAVANSNVVQPSRTTVSLQIFAACQKPSPWSAPFQRNFTEVHWPEYFICFKDIEPSLLFFFHLLVLQSQLVTWIFKSNESTKKVKDLEFYSRFLSLVFTPGLQTVMHCPGAQHCSVALTIELHGNAS